MDDKIKTLLDALELNKQNISDNDYKEAIELLRNTNQKQKRYNVELTYVELECCVEMNTHTSNLELSPNICCERYNGLKIDEEFFILHDDDESDGAYRTDWQSVVSMILIPNQIARTYPTGLTKIHQSGQDSVHGCKIYYNKDNVLVKIKPIEALANGREPTEND